MKMLLIILGLAMLSLLVLTVAVYWLFLDSRVKNKKAILSYLGTTYKVVFWTILYCTGVNLILIMIIEFATAIETSSVSVLMMQWQFIAYCVFLIIPRMFMFCLQISVEREETGEKISFLKGLQLFYTNPKKKLQQKDSEQHN